MHVYHWKSEKGPVLLKWLFYHTETINKFVWLRMARIEVAPTSGRMKLFQVFALVSQIK